MNPLADLLGLHSEVSAQRARSAGLRGRSRSIVERAQQALAPISRERSHNQGGVEGTGLRESLDAHRSISVTSHMCLLEEKGVILPSQEGTSFSLFATG